MIVEIKGENRKMREQMINIKKLLSFNDEKIALFIVEISFFPIPMLIRMEQTTAKLTEISVPMMKMR